MPTVNSKVYSEKDLIEVSRAVFDRCKADLDEAVEGIREERRRDKEDFHQQLVEQKSLYEKEVKELKGVIDVLREENKSLRDFAEYKTLQVKETVNTELKNWQQSCESRILVGATKSLDAKVDKELTEKIIKHQDSYGAGVLTQIKGMLEEKVKELQETHKAAIYSDLVKELTEQVQKSLGGDVKPLFEKMAGDYGQKFETVDGHIKRLEDQRAKDLADNAQLIVGVKDTVSVSVKDVEARYKNEIGKAYKALDELGNSYQRQSKELEAANNMIKMLESKSALLEDAFKKLNPTITVNTPEVKNVVNIPPSKLVRKHIEYDVDGRPSDIEEREIGE